MAAAVLLIAATTAQAQSIIGCVVDAKTKEPLIGAVVSLQGTDTKTVTDTAGQFHFDHLSTTTPYTLLVKYVGYKNITIDGVLSKASAAEDVITVALKPDEQQLKGVTVTGVKRRNTVTAAVLEVKNSPVIVSNISAQDIKLTQDANAGEVIRRVPGVSLIDNKFVMVRGLAQRYNNVWMNGGAVPSSEADQRAFSFDMIPSNQIDNLTIVKSPTPEYPADYTGGFIMIDTKEIPLENAFHVSVSGNWNSASAFKSFLGTKQSGADFLGFDNGLCSLHGGIDATLADLGKNSGGNTMYSLSDNHLNNDWTVKNQHPWGDLKLSADWSHSWTLPAGKLGAIAAVNYTNDIHAGVRFEYDRMELISNTKSYETSHESHYYRHSDLFPSANATYKLDEKNQIRLSYGRSVNRPEFREVSPSVYYDFDLASNVEGNFNLKNCYVDNLDVRYEWYPSRGEMISFPERPGDQRSDLRFRGGRNDHRPHTGELLQR